MKKIDTIEKRKKLDLQTETVRALARPDLVVGGMRSIVAGTDNNCTTSACSC